MSDSDYCFLTHTHVSQETGEVVWYSHLFKNFPQFVVIHTVKVLRLVSEAEVDICLEFPGFLYDVMNNNNLISVSSAFSKFSLYIWKFLVHLLWKPILKEFEHYLAKMWNECNCVAVWTVFGIALWDSNENWPLLVLWPPLSCPNLLAYWVQRLNYMIFKYFS